MRWQSIYIYIIVWRFIILTWHLVPLLIISRSRVRVSGGATSLTPPHPSLSLPNHNHRPILFTLKLSLESIDWFYAIQFLKLFFFWYFERTAPLKGYKCCAAELSTLYNKIIYGCSIFQRKKLNEYFELACHA